MSTGRLPVLRRWKGGDVDSNFMGGFYSKYNIVECIHEYRDAAGCMRSFLTQSCSAVEKSTYDDVQGGNNDYRQQGAENHNTEGRYTARN